MNGKAGMIIHRWKLDQERIDEVLDKKNGGDNALYRRKSPRGIRRLTKAPD